MQQSAQQTDLFVNELEYLTMLVAQMCAGPADVMTQVHAHTITHTLTQEHTHTHTLTHAFTHSRIHAFTHSPYWAVAGEGWEGVERSGGVGNSGRG